jgi:DNA polymerase III subunit epsilon
MKNSKSENIFDTNFIVCDVETTGLSSTNNRVIEIAMIKVHNGEIKEKISSLINPMQHIPREITYLTGITNEDVLDKPTFGEFAYNIVDFMKCDDDSVPVFTGHNVSFDYKFLTEEFKRCGERFDQRTLCTCKLARRLLRRLKSKSLINVAEYYNIGFSNYHRAYDDTLATAKILLIFLDMLNEKYEYETIDEIIRFQNTKIYKDENSSPILKKLGISLKQFPNEPGVYFMRSRSGEILYIGKAKNLKERISSYFRFNSEIPVKMKKLLRNIYSIDYEITGSELSALILESNLIKKNKPRYNSAIKRFRFYPYLKIDVQNEFPKIEKVYEIENDGANYYGPFRSGLTVNKLIKEINLNFKLRKCDFKKLKPDNNHSTCMYYDIGRCNAPCNLTQSKVQYKNEVLRVHSYITSLEKNSVRILYKNMMQEFAGKMEFERAAFLRDRLDDIQKVLNCHEVITSAINDKKIIIKCRSEKITELFFIQNGKLINTYKIDKHFDQRSIVDELSETAEYLFFSLSKYVKHKFNAFERDEIKVISNWLAQNHDKNSVMEIHEDHTQEDVMRFLCS